MKNIEKKKQNPFQFFCFPQFASLSAALCSEFVNNKLHIPLTNGYILRKECFLPQKVVVDEEFPESILQPGVTNREEWKANKTVLNGLSIVK